MSWKEKRPINNFECNIGAFSGLGVEAAPGPCPGPRPGRSTTLITHRLCPGSDFPGDSVLSFAYPSCLPSCHSTPFAVCRLPLGTSTDSGELPPSFELLEPGFGLPFRVLLWSRAPAPPARSAGRPEESRPLERLTWHFIEDKLVSMKWKTVQGLDLDRGPLKGAMEGKGFWKTRTPRRTRLPGQLPRDIRFAVRMSLEVRHRRWTLQVARNQRQSGWPGGGGAPPRGAGGGGRQKPNERQLKKN